VAFAKMDLVMNEEKILTLQEVAEYLKVSVEQVYRFVKRDDNPLPVIIISDKTKRVRMSELQAWLSQQKDDPEISNSKKGGEQ
jgi:excisionase family DNA binding protein